MLRTRLRKAGNYGVLRQFGGPKLRLRATEKPWEEALKGGKMSNKR